jgi:DNA-binding winged helix-turn-helix (wHTH) protein/Tfp pilus assembly protein PilF
MKAVIFLVDFLGSAMPPVRHYEFGSFRLDTHGGVLFRDGERLALTPKAIEILILLVKSQSHPVTKDELLQKVWAGTIVEEGTLTSHISILRKTLGAGEYIETIPKRGYRFVAPVKEVPDAFEANAMETASLGRRRWKIVAPVVAAAVLIAAGLLWRSRKTPTLTEKDTVVLADFTNTTGDTVFDSTLRQGLIVQLEQSPFLSLVSDDRIQQTLRLMGQPPDTRLTPEVAREICERTATAAVLEGSIASLGGQYVLGLKAVNCHTGEYLADEQATADGKEHVLKALGEAAVRLRGKLGESFSTVQKFSTPIEDATTPSLEALKAYSMGRKIKFEKGDAAGLPYFLSAVELDPKFAAAYAWAAVSYSNLGQATRASENAKKAFDQRARVSEPEKYTIDAFYYTFVTGDLEKANQVYAQWRQSYPRNYIPAKNLGDNYTRLGQWNKALRETEESMSMQPNSVRTATNLAGIQVALNRMDDAMNTVEQLQERKPNSYALTLLFYQMAFLRGDQETMSQQLAWAAERPGEDDWLLSAQSDTEAYLGRLAKAREFSKRAVDSARRADSKEAGALWEVNAALREAEFGNPTSARRDAMAATALATGKYVRSVAALALSRAGNGAQAQKMAETLNRELPQDTILQGYWLPLIHAAIALNAKNAAGALQVLETTAPYELAECEPFQVGMLYPMYLRGQAYLMAHRGKEAATEFQKMVEHPGILINFPLGALARLGLARAYALQGDAAKARTAYQNFLTLWKDAYPEIPILKQAKAEYAKLQ